MATKKIQTTIEKQEVVTEAVVSVETPVNETVELSEAYKYHGSIVVKHGVIEFVDGKAMISSELAEDLRNQGFIK